MKRLEQNVGEFVEGFIKGISSFGEFSRSESYDNAQENSCYAKGRNLGDTTLLLSSASLPYVLTAGVVGAILYFNS